MDSLKTAEDMLGRGWFERKEISWDRAVGTGLPRLDTRVGGGLPSGIVEITGEESVGKTLMVGHILRAAQREGKQSALVQTEYPDLAYIENIGVDLSKLLYVRGPSVPVMRVIGSLMSEDVIVCVDSATSMQDETGFWSDWFDNMCGFLRATKRGMPSGACLVLTSQARQGKSRVPGKSFRSKTVSASRYFEFDFDARFKLTRENVSERKYDMVVMVEKHPMAAPGVVVDFEVRKGHPISIGLDVLKMGLESKCVEARGAVYCFGDVTLGRGMAASSKYLEENPEVMGEVLDKSVETWRT